ncbi:MAG: cyclic nucleotide-binding domain-containing protein [Proteobacteria bacterium]|nr:cyclic nucleotide-binding domain-containing protein [Pseudomonadota bacterium]MBU1736770.1 cyclic nucleotide-binding domain-containing protein [Pseudomonadota bacterium]
MAAEKGLKVCDLGNEVLGQIFKFLDENEISGLCPYLEHMIWKKGEILMNDGEAGDFMGFLLAGKLAVKKETSFPGRFTLVAILDKGAMVGEISAVDRGLRTATVAAMEDSELLILSCDSLDRLLHENSLLGIKILKRIIHVLSLRQRRSYDRLSAIL